MSKYRNLENMETIAKQKDNKLSKIVFFAGILFLFVAYKCTAQEDRRFKVGDFWYSLSIRTITETDTVDFFTVSKFSPYNFYCLGTKIGASEKCIGRCTLIITYENGLTDYLGSFNNVNCDGYSYYLVDGMDLQHIKTKKIRSISVYSNLYAKTYNIDMSQFDPKWYSSLTN